MSSDVDKKSNLSSLSDKEKIKIDRVGRFKIVGLIILYLFILVIRMHFFVWCTYTKIAYFIFDILFWGIPLYLFVNFIIWRIKGLTKQFK